MTSNEKEYYYAAGKKVKLTRLTDCFAVKYKSDMPSRAMERNLAERAEFADAEERKDLPKYRMVLVTMPPSTKLESMRASVRSVEDDANVESVNPVYREAQSGLRMVATDELTVRFKENVSDADIAKLNSDNGVEIIEKNRFVANQYLLRVANPEDLLSVANKYQESHLVEFAEPNFIAEAKKANLTDDEFLNEQWHLHNTGQHGGLIGEDIGAIDAWEISKGVSHITIAIIDDGVDIDHPDLKANIWKNPDGTALDKHGWNFFDDDDDPRPRKFTPPYDRLAGNDSHGTPCAGVAAAVGNNTAGVSGIAYNCKILPVKIFLADDLVLFSVLADAIRYAGQKADVLSNSWGIPPSSNVAQAIKDVTQTGRGGKGTPVFVATGNDYRSSIGFPASVPEAIAVGASTNQGRRSSYSNYGEGIDFVAPSNGGTKGIFSTDVSISGRGFNVGNINSGDAEGLYTNSFGGTSSATPLAAGVAALILSVNPDLRWDQVRKYMRDTADKIDQMNGSYVNGYSVEYGFGRVNAHKALEAVQSDMEVGGTVRIVSKEVTPEIPIPDRDMSGITAPIHIDEEGTIDMVEEVAVNISHSYRGDLLVSLISPDNHEIKLHWGQGGGANHLVTSYNIGTTPDLQTLEGKSVRGSWLLKAIDRWPDDTGTLNRWSLKFRVKENLVRGSASPGLHIPDDDPTGVTSVIPITDSGKVKDVRVRVDISHTYIGDLIVKILSPSNKAVLLHNMTGGTTDNLQSEYAISSHAQLNELVGENIEGDWKLAVSDNYGIDTGKLNRWEIEITI